MSDIFDSERVSKSAPVTIGDDLYSASVSDLEDRIKSLHGEIARTELALTKKQSELSEAETLFSPKTPSG